MVIFAAQTNSPATQLALACSASDTTITLSNAGIIDLTPPFLLTLGYDLPYSETVLVTAVNGNVLTVQRGIDGAATEWPTDTLAARVFTAYDWNSVADVLNNLPPASSAPPLMDDGNEGDAGEAEAYARADHVHPSDTSRLPVNNPAMQGVPTAPTAPEGTSTTQVATTAFVQQAVAAIGTVFNLKGSVTDYSQLPSTGNTVGDVWYAENDVTIGGVTYPGHVGYIWITDSTQTERWEELGATIDLSGYAQLDEYGKVNADETSARAVFIDANVTLAAQHCGTLLVVSEAATVTIPTGLPLLTEIEVMNYSGSSVTVQAAAGVTLNGIAGGSKTIPAQYTSGALKCIAANTWVIQGAIL